MEAMQHLGFGATWCNLVANLLSTSSTRILLNGEPGELIQHQRGLRQGDPLSPMLFILAMDVLNSLFVKAQEEGLLQPLSTRVVGQHLSLYADDVALFIKPVEDELLLTRDILNIFGEASGLETNLQKSNIVPIRCEEVPATVINETLPCAVSEFPCTYLGLPLSNKKLRKSDLMPWIEKIADKLPGWKAGLMRATLGNMLNWRSKVATKKLLSTVACAKPDDSEFESVDAPLEPETWEGSFLCGLLKNLPHIFLATAAKQLQELSNQREDTLNRWEHSIGSKEDCLHRRIAELKEQECQTAIEDIMYMLIVYKFFKIEVPMVPNLSKLISNRRLQLWPPRETDLESIHGPEVLELIREHLTSIIRWVHRNGPKINRSTLRIKRLQFGRIYSASIMYGYFLKSVSIRHRLELTLTRSEELPPQIQFLNAQFTNKQEQEEAVGGSGEVSSSPKPSSVVNPHDLKGYMMGFDPKTLQLCAKLRSCEAANLIERHSWALFGQNMEPTQENDEAVILDPSSLKRLLLEAIAFGSFLWDVEDYVDEIYKLSDS